MSTISPKDDSFHPIMSDDPHWTETWWSGFHAVERDICGTIYFWTRPNLGVCSVQAAVWDDRTEKTWEMPYYRNLWHVPIPQGDLTDLTTEGLTFKCLEPLKKYHVLYEASPALSLDLTYKALMAPHFTPYGEGMGHFDQPLRVTGTMNLHGEEIDVDCLEMRDRSWYVRSDGSPRPAFYTYGIASETDSFHTMGMYSDNEGIILAGYLMQDGEKSDLASGRRRVVERQNGYPVRIAIEAEDKMGRKLEAEGHCLNRIAQHSVPGMFNFMSLTKWNWNNTIVYGEDHDVNPPKV